jgi:hypothetical protein
LSCEGTSELDRRAPADRHSRPVVYRNNRVPNPA